MRICFENFGGSPDSSRGGYGLTDHLNSFPLKFGANLAEKGAVGKLRAKLFAATAAGRELAGEGKSDPFARGFGGPIPVTAPRTRDMIPSPEMHHTPPLQIVLAI